MTHLGAWALPLDGVSAAREAELVLGDRGTLDEVSVLKALRAEGALEGTAASWGRAASTCGGNG